MSTAKVCSILRYGDTAGYLVAFFISRSSYPFEGQPSPRSTNSAYCCSLNSRATEETPQHRMLSSCLLIPPRGVAPDVVSLQQTSTSLLSSRLSRSCVGASPRISAPLLLSSLRCVAEVGWSVKDGSDSGTGRIWTRVPAAVPSSEMPQRGQECLQKKGNNDALLLDRRSPRRDAGRVQLRF
jgi:hypothetical protein